MPDDEGQDEDDPTIELKSYQRRYEDPNWQQLVIDWIGHAKHVEKVDPHRIALVCTQLFLSQYWWWDSYVRSAYCDSLLEQFKEHWGTRPWVAQLVIFRENYVSGEYAPGWLAELGEIDEWQQTERALLELWRQLVGRDHDAVPTDQTERRVAMYLSLFLSDALRFAGVGPDGIEWLERARRTADEKWIIPWIDYYKAETLFELEQFDEAYALVESMEPVVVRGVDHDLRMVLGMFLSEFAWRDGDHAKSIDILARTLLVAYAYHTQQECDGKKRLSNPNQYSQLRHKEVLERLTGRLDEIESENGPEDRQVAEARVDAFFQPYANYLRQKYRTVEHTRPAPPSDQDLVDGQTSAYYRDLVAVVRQMRPRLEEPLETPLTG